ncbi:hypothetical protein [Cohnella mopanensis]|uniref:hypothetical protein n=1 Tax=Cohnella mopanensis TaxID=2911966 RepID=UPI001EF78CBA|nr:hypothetical protein [Cohnella mopanensis]
MRRRNYKSIQIMTMVITMGLLAGCAELSDDKIEENVNKQVEKVNNSISKTVQNATIDWMDETKQNGLNNKLSLKQEIGSATSVLLHNEVGNIEVKTTSDDQMTVSTTIWVNKERASEKDLHAILDNAETEVIADGDQLKIVTHPKDHPKHNMWDWAQDKYGYSEMSIDYVVEIPAGITSYEITSNVGSLQLSNLEGKYDVHNDVGSILIEGARIVGESRIQSSTGSVQLGIDRMDSDSRLEAATEVGSIIAKLADSLACDLETVTELGQVTGADLGESKRNGGGPLLKLRTSIGSITVE